MSPLKKGECASVVGGRGIDLEVTSVFNSSQMIFFSMLCIFKKCFFLTLIILIFSDPLQIFPTEILEENISSNQ